MVLIRDFWLLEALATLLGVCPFKGEHTAQSSLLHCFQCAMICRDEAQCGTKKNDCYTPY